MATYAVGDIQGCHTALRKLVDRIAFDPARDTLWLVGDLVNRGPHSLAVLRYVKALGDSAITVLGNHDLHLLAVAARREKRTRHDTVDAVLRAPDRDELLHWLRQRKMMHAAQGYAMVHAGLLPQWTIAQAVRLAAEVEAALRGNGFEDFLGDMYGDQPDRWHDELRGVPRLRVIVNAMTRMRLCTAQGRMEFTHNGEPAGMPRGFMPWFRAPQRRSRRTPVIFGHWSALGLLLEPKLIALDSGCVWGGRLSALRLEDRRLFQCDCRKGRTDSR